MTGTGQQCLRVLCVVLAFICLPQFVAAQSPARLVDSASVYYQRGDYEAAAAMYRAVINQGIDDARVWYNLGNAEFKSGKMGKAIKAYLRAQRLAPRDPDIEANLQFVRLYATDKIESNGALFIAGWADWFADHFTFGEWITVSTLLFLVLVILAALKIWYHRHGRAGWYWLGVGVFLWLIVLGGAARRYHDEFIRERGVVIVEETPVRGGPGSDYTLQFTGHDGLVFTVDRREENWLLVSFENGVKGWLNADAVERI